MVCRSARCSYMCVLKPHGYSCLCPASMELAVDQRTCVGMLAVILLVGSSPLVLFKSFVRSVLQMWNRPCLHQQLLRQPLSRRPLPRELLQESQLNAFLNQSRLSLFRQQCRALRLSVRTTMLPNPAAQLSTRSDIWWLWHVSQESISEVFSAQCP